MLHLLSVTDVLVLSPYILAELERVLAYPRLLKRSGLTTQDIAEYLENLAAFSCLVTPKAVPEGVLRDPTDAAILGTAVAGNASVLCTRDEDLFGEKVRRFCSEIGIQLLTDLQFIGRFTI